MSDNVYDIPLSPEAQEALSKATAQKQAVDEWYIQRIFYTIDFIERGETPWQKQLKGKVDDLHSGSVEWIEDMQDSLERQGRILQVLVDDLHVIRRARLILPNILALACLFLGGASAAFVMHLFTH